MSLTSRLWRVIRGRAEQNIDLDPDDILREYRKLREKLREHQEQDSGYADSDGERSKRNSHSGESDYRKACARLEIEPGASIKEAKKAWRKLMKKYHPDQHQNDERKREIATKLSAALTEAYEIVVEHEESKP